MKNEMVAEEFEKYKVSVPARVLNEVPMMTAQVLSTVLFKSLSKKRARLAETSSDRTYYVVTSSGDVSSYKIVHKTRTAER